MLSSTFQVVIQDDPGRSGPGIKSAHMTAQEVLRRLVEKELQIQRPRPGQGHHKAGELAFGPADHDGAKVRPVNLGLLRRENLQSQEGFVWLRAQTGDDAPQLFDAASVAAIPDHLVDARSAQPRILLQGLAHKREIRIDHGRPQRLGVLKEFYLNGAPYGVGVDVQGLRNRADFPMLGVEIAANLYAGFGTDHASSPSSWNLGKRIDEAAWPATDRAAQPRIGAFFLSTGQPGWQRDRNRHRDRFSTAEWCRRNDRKGTLIRHASRRVTVPVRTLPVAVVESALRTPLVAAIGRAALAAPSLGAASRAAIALPAVAVRANPEHPPASLAATNSRPEKPFSMNRHPPTQAAFDNSNGACQGRTSFDGALLTKVAKPGTPRCFEQRGVLCRL